MPHGKRVLGAARHPWTDLGLDGFRLYQSRLQFNASASRGRSPDSPAPGTGRRRHRLSVWKPTPPRRRRSSRASPQRAAARPGNSAVRRAVRTSSQDRLAAHGERSRLAERPLAATGHRHRGRCGRSRQWLLRWRSARRHVPLCRDAWQLGHPPLSHVAPPFHAVLPQFEQRQATRRDP